ncbi:nidogen-like domain-containing protein [Dactylosporangium cerinum]|uniref:Nidogen-like domain-containing protein n=1 Tax=Dactylosporangium cerinum TaxID=1434730 RepID=A0ABV9WBC6_9ACTN
MTFRGRRAFRFLALLILATQAAFLGLGVRPAAAAGPDAVVADAGCTTNSLGRSDDGSSGQVPLGFPVNFFGTTYSGMYVNNNGDVTFGSAYSGFSGLNLAAFGNPIVAVAFFDVDTRAPATTPVSHGPITFAGRPAYCVNWVNVGYFNNGADRLNSSQLILVDRSETGAGNFDLVMNYDRLTYEPAGGLTVGYSSGTATYVHPGSGVPGALGDANTTTGLIRNSGGSGHLGRYVYQVRGGQPTPPGGPPASSTASSCSPCPASPSPSSNCSAAKATNASSPGPASSPAARSSPSASPPPSACSRDTYASPRS